jgi:hypothetical protein
MHLFQLHLQKSLMLQGCQLPGTGPVRASTTRKTAVGPCQAVLNVSLHLQQCFKPESALSISCMNLCADPVYLEVIHILRWVAVQLLSWRKDLGQAP